MTNSYDALTRIHLHLPNHRSRRKYGDKLDWRNISDEYLRQSSIEEDIQTHTYQITVLHKEFAQPLNRATLHTSPPPS